MQINYEINSAKGTTEGNFQMNMAPFVPYQHNPVEEPAPEPEADPEPEEETPVLMMAPPVSEPEPVPEEEVTPEEDAEDE